MKNNTKSYLVIGAASGIGSAITEMLLEQGHKVYGTYNERPITREHPNLISRQLNVLDQTLAIDEKPDQINGLVYSPGSINLRPFNRLKQDSFVEDYKLQVVGAIGIIQEMLPALKNVETSSIVLFSTVAVQTGFPFHAQVSASKGAIEGLTRALAAEFAPKIRVNAIAPSLTDTPLAGRLLSDADKKNAQGEKHPMKRVGEPEDIARMATFLLSEHSSWMTGQILHVDGGMSSIK